MSLLIKALDKAQNAKAEEAQAQNAKNEAQTNKANAEQAKAKQKPALDLSLGPTASLAEAPVESSISRKRSSQPLTLDYSNQAPEKLSAPNLPQAKLAPAHVASAQVVSARSGAANPSAANAANVFTAKGETAKKQMQPLAIVAGLALMSLLGMGAYFYRFIDAAPDVVPAPHIASQRPAEPAPQAATVAEALPAPAQIEPAANVQSEQVAPNAPLAIAPDETVIVASNIKTAAKKTHKKAVFPNEEKPSEEVLAEETLAANDVDVVAAEPEVKISKKSRKSKAIQLGDAIASESASISRSGVSVSKSRSQQEVNPTLMRAYEAYNAGKDAEAQKLYKQVLQRDMHSVDALLGLGAIAQRQGRAADANGWYGKVLEVDPRNNIAQTALLENSPQSNEVSSETRLKNMLAKQPDDANLHVALGNYYAEQNQWAAAQQAYFEAYRLHASADNAFNLAVSLDQMGKPKLALPYYQRALELAQTNSNGIDKAALEARIAAIQ